MVTQWDSGISSSLAPDWLFNPPGLRMMEILCTWRTALDFHRGKNGREIHALLGLAGSSCPPRGQRSCWSIDRTRSRRCIPQLRSVQTFVIHLCWSTRITEYGLRRWLRVVEISFAECLQLLMLRKIQLEGLSNISKTQESSSDRRGPMGRMRKWHSSHKSSLPGS